MSNRLQVEAQKRRENNARPNLQEGNFTSFETKRYDGTGGSGLRIDVSVGGGASGARGGGGGGGGGGIPYVSPTSQNAPSSSYFDAPRSPAPAYSPGGHGPDEGARLLQAPPSPYRNPNSPIRAQFAAPPSPALSTTSTLVGRDAFPLDGKMGYEERRLSAGPDNDRMAPTGAGGEKGRDFWKRFSTVAHKHEQEQVGSQSQWLKKQSRGHWKLQAFAWTMAVLIVLGIAGGLYYHFVIQSKKTPSGNNNLPSKPSWGEGPSSDIRAHPSTAMSSVAQASSTTTTTSRRMRMAKRGH